MLRGESGAEYVQYEGQYSGRDSGCHGPVPVAHPPDGRHRRGEQYQRHHPGPRRRRGYPVPGADDAFDDRDAYKVSLTKGRSYTLTMDGGGSNVQATLLDRNGKTVAGANGGANHPAVIKYKAKATGDFYFRTAGGYRYSVSMK